MSDTYFRSSKGRSSAWFDHGGPRVTQLSMRLAPLHALPEVRLPPGYALRTFRAGDEDGWAALMNSEIGEWDKDAVRTAFLTQEGVEPDGIFFAMRGEEHAATATAQSSTDASSGYVHMVTAHPAHRGRGLGRAVTLAVLHRLRDIGCTDALLLTDDHRLPAIRTYLNLGFDPEHTASDHPERWARVLARLATHPSGNVGHLNWRRQ